MYKQIKTVEPGCVEGTDDFTSKNILSIHVVYGILRRRLQRMNQKNVLGVCVRSNVW